MKETKTAPKNRGFFNEHGSSLSAYGIIGYLGQSLSGLSLAYAVFALLVAQVFAGGQVAGYAFAGLVMMAGVVGFFVELTNRVLARRAIRPFVVKDLFADNPDTAKRHKILNRSYLVGLVAVALLSYLLSIVGSTYYAQDTTAGRELVSLDSIRTEYAGQEAATLRAFATDSATVAGPYDVQLTAARVSFAADSSALMRQRSDYNGCARRGNDYCKKMQRSYLTKIDEKRAELASITAGISRDRAAALSAALAYRDGRLSDIRTAAASVTAEAKATNRAADEDKEADAGFKGLVFIILTVAGQTLFYFVVYLQLQVEAGSEIEHELKPNEFWGMPTVVQEFKITAAWRIERGARRLIRWLFGEPDGQHNTTIPYADLYSGNDDEGEDETALAKGPFIGLNGHSKEGETIVVDSAIKQCKNCRKDFRPKAHNQAYCTVSCRTEYHTNKHNGRAFDAGKYHGLKPSKT